MQLDSRRRPQCCPPKAPTRSALRHLDLSGLERLSDATQCAGLGLGIEYGT